MFRSQYLNVRTPLYVRRPEAMLRYGSAFVSTAVACVATYLIWSLIQPAVSPLFFLAVIFSAWYGGLHAGLLSAALSTLACNLLFVTPYNTFDPGAGDLLRLTVFMLAAVSVGALTLSHTQLEESAERIKKELAVTLKSIGDAVITTDARGRVTLMNAVAQSVTGWSEAEARGRDRREIFQLLDQQSREEVDGVVGRVIRDNAVIALSSAVLMVTRDGLEVPITEIATPLRGHNGEINGVVLVLRTASNAIEKTDSQLLSEKLDLLGSVDVPMFALDQAGRCLFITQAATAMLGYHSEELVGREIHEIIHMRSDGEAGSDGRNEFFGATYPEAVNGTLLRHNGVSTPVGLSIAPILVGDKVCGTVVTIVDQTERYRAEEALLKLETIVDALEDAVVLHTADGVITGWSASAARLFDYSAEEVMGRHVSIIHAPGRKRELNDLFQRVVRREKVAPFETMRIGKGGEQITVWIRVVALTDPTGAVTGVSQIIKDLREEKARKEKLFQTQSSRATRDYSSPVEGFVEGTAAPARSSRVNARPQTPGSHRNNSSAAPKIIGKSPVMQKLFSTVERIAPTESSVLITGATGTGKELIARAIHSQSPRANGPFVDINCSAMPDTLIEAELFGHQKGTFTGAHEHRAGLFEVAAGGTLFLDEVDALNLSAQAKLLRVIQERRVRRIGGRTNIDVDVRIISASNCDLSLAISDNRFRADLYYRLRVAPLQLPELYQREGDIELLVEYFLRRHVEKHGGTSRQFSSEAMKALAGYPWPGNVRELENAVEYASTMGTENILGIDALPPELAGGATESSSDNLKEVLEAYINDSVPLAEIEKRYILSVLQQFGGNQVKAAAALGIDRSKLYRRLKQYGVMAVRFLQEEQDGLQLRSWDSRDSELP